MLYFDVCGEHVSALGLGTMRLPTLGDDGHIDEEKAGRLFDLAMENGINYYDTAWGYHQENSELVTGKLLSRYPRSSFYLASKFPGFIESCRSRVPETFERQLEKCRVEYFDFYLLHNINDSNLDAYLDRTNGMVDYLLEQRRNGRIRHLGFSSHASIEGLSRFLEVYGDEMEFGQLQINYLDWHYQRASEAYRMLGERGIPVWVMEPVRGGRLCTLPPADTARLQALRPEANIPSWAFRFLQSLPRVKVVLSGMSNEEQLLDNIATFSAHRPLNENEMQVLLGIGERMAAGVPCTACRYCVDRCPQGLDIPQLLSLYNEILVGEDKDGARKALSALAAEKRPEACVGCEACVSRCPQHIKIPKVLAEFAQTS